MNWTNFRGARGMSRNGPNGPKQFGESLRPTDGMGSSISGEEGRPSLHWKNAAPQRDSAGIEGRLDRQPRLTFSRQHRVSQLARYSMGNLTLYAKGFGIVPLLTLRC